MSFNNVISRADAGALIPEDVSREIVESIPTSSAVMRLGRRLPNMPRNQRRVPVLASLPTAYFVSSNAGGAPGLKQTTEMSWANKYLDAEEIACIVPIPEDVLDDADYDIWGQVRPRISEEIGRVFDAAVLFGANAPAAWPVDIVTAATAAGNSVALGANADLYDDLLSENGMIATIETDGFMATGHIAAVSMRGRLRGLRDANGNPIFVRDMQGATPYVLDGSPIEFPMNGCWDGTRAHLISGSFNELVYALRQDISYKVLSEAIIQDAAGNIVYNLAQQDMVALRVVMRIAWQVPNPINRLQAVEANRYPFGVLTP